MPVRGTCSPEFSRRPRRDYNYANALLRGRREQATDVWNGSSWKEHLQHGTIRAVPSATVIEYKAESEMKHGPGTPCISSRGFQPCTAKEVAEFFHSLAADRCHRLRIATDRTPVFLFMKSDERETLRIASRKAFYSIAVAAPPPPPPPPNRNPLFGSN